MKRIICMLIALCGTMYARSFTIKPITPSLLQEYKQSFAAFKKTQRKQFTALRYTPTFLVKAVLRMQGLKEVDPHEAYIFLERALAHEDKLDHAVAQIETVPENMRFLQETFTRLNKEPKKDRATLTHIMRTPENRHQFVPDPALLARVNDEKFFPFAACQMFALHLLESKGSAKQKGK